MKSANSGARKGGRRGATPRHRAAHTKDREDLPTARAARPVAERSGSGESFQEQRKALVEVWERKYFADLHRKTGGNVSEMARRSGLERSTVRHYLVRHGLRGSG
jgi:transcriptional regulator of acetoin/glycerol metabolism